MTVKDLKKQSAVPASSNDEPPAQGREKESRGIHIYSTMLKLKNQV